MISTEQIRRVVDHPVFDSQGQKIGEAKHVFVDGATGEPEWVSVRTGLFGRRESFVPVQDATVVQDHLEVPYPKGKVKEAPNVDVDGGGRLSADQERHLYAYYGIRWDAFGHAGDGGARRGPDGGGRAETAGGAPAAARDDAMTRSEERMHVGTERYASGRARLRKYVETEEVERTVPVRHEEARIEREPITEANRDAALSGPEISEAEHEITLHEERPVVETEAVPVERVRLTPEEHTEERTVRGTVRKERIEAETEQADESGEARRRPPGGS